MTKLEAVSSGCAQRWHNGRRLDAVTGLGWTCPLARCWLAAALAAALAVTALLAGCGGGSSGPGLSGGSSNGVPAAAAAMGMVATQPIVSGPGGGAAVSSGNGRQEAGDAGFVSPPHGNSTTDPAQGCGAAGGCRAAQAGATS
jgi:hypothetical protein